tara:strand:- start:271 stop:750 length:480 start_codon:yes stop_codon:yes gene_type:complete
MIKYKLKCKSTYCLSEKEFEGWFKNIEAFEKQKDQGLINCPICGSDKVLKLLATPNVKTGKIKKTEDIRDENITIRKSEDNLVVNDNLKNISTILRTIKKEIEKNSTFVGDKFVSQVKSMKEGKIKEKPIHGHGTNKEIQELRDEGIDVVNVPWISDDH